MRLPISLNKQKKIIKRFETHLCGFILFAALATGLTIIFTENTIALLKALNSAATWNISAYFGFGFCLLIGLLNLLSLVCVEVFKKLVVDKLISEFKE